MSYHDFLNSKLRRAEPSGFEPVTLCGRLFDWQADLVGWSCRQGRAAVWADTGLGKTLMQLAWAEQVVKHTGGRVLILCPLAVAGQTLGECSKFNVDIHAGTARELNETAADVVITNYERLEKFGDDWAGVVLDESSILKNYTGKTKRRLCDHFKDVPYWLCCTATPAPNDHMELGNHAEFLGVMPSNEMISRWFINDTMAAGNYKLLPHGERDFWRWVTSWAVTITKPSDLGYSDDGFELPPLQKHFHESASELCPPPAGQFWHTENVAATNMHKIKRATAGERARKVAEIVGDEPGPWLVWCDTDYEADALRSALPDAREVRGSHPAERKEKELSDFTFGRTQKLITKPEIAGFGLNWQHCHKMAFCGVSFSFERFYQAVRRCWRFGQKHAVDVHVVTTDAEATIANTVAVKEEKFHQMKREMAEAVRESQLDSIYGRRKLQEPKPVKVTCEESWVLMEGDCVDAVKQLKDDSVGLSVYSPPFANLYIYSDSVADMGNSADMAEFFEHFDYLIAELLRVTVPGRLSAVHCKDLPLYFNRDGAAGLKDFPGEIVRRHESAGWTFHSRVTIWKDPVIEMQRTKNNGLLHKTLCRDSSQVRQGMADYVLVFRKTPADTLMSEKPITRPHSRETCFDGYAGIRERIEASAWCKAGEPELGNGYGLEVWQRYASPVWFDIDQTRVLNYRQARDGGDSKHICPLQLDVIDRCVELWSAEGDVVFSPFAGIGSEGYVALQKGRRFVGCELKDSYAREAEKHLRLAARQRQERQQPLFAQEPTG